MMNTYAEEQGGAGFDFDLPAVQGTCAPLQGGRAVRVDAVMKGRVQGGEVGYVAAAPGDRGLSFSGSMLPAPSAEQAFENTPVRGRARLDAGGRLSLTVPVPNSYYVDMGATLVPPMLYLVYRDGGSGGQEVRVAVPVARPTPYRSLTYPSTRTGPGFYAGAEALPVRTQEQVLRDSAYCASGGRAPAASFWGLRPPC